MIDPIKLRKGCWIFPYIDEHKDKFKIRFVKNIHGEDYTKYDKRLEALEKKWFKTRQEALTTIEELQ